MNGKRAKELRRIVWDGQNQSFFGLKTYYSDKVRRLSVRFYTDSNTGKNITRAEWLNLDPKDRGFYMSVKVSPPVLCDSFHNCYRRLKKQYIRGEY